MLKYVIRLVRFHVYVNRLDIRFPIRSMRVIMQGVFRLIWSGRLEWFFVDSKGAKISKNGNNIICRLSKNNCFLFYTPGSSGNIMPAMPS